MVSSPLRRGRWDFPPARRTEATLRTQAEAFKVVPGRRSRALLCFLTHLCRICSSLYSSTRITTPANVSTNMATRMSRFQHDFPAGPGEPQALGGGAAVCRGTSKPCLGLMMDRAWYGWSVSHRTSSESPGWGGICREVLLVTRRPNCIVAVWFSSAEEVIFPSPRTRSRTLGGGKSTGLQC